GRLVALTEVPVRPDEDLVRHLGQQIGSLLEKKYTVKEFSFDIGIDMNKRSWIFDINSKPMTFDEQDIQRKRVERLTRIFLEEK
ncbi:YheC/YheD family protein, partial [Pseudomonas sp. 2822-17]|uniref:YheC/YheD family protein n=1 Tax=Pseudomonas sp. 2822-17 TaxID=1712678 RepID=UPI001C48FB7A